MTKNGKVAAAFGLSLITLLLLAEYQKNKQKGFVQSNHLTIQNYINRLKEYDITPDKQASSFFFELVEYGYDPLEAFELVQNQINDSGEFIR
jgi:hypothetical protein